MDDFETDDELAGRLGQLLARIDPVPASVIVAAKASAAWREFDAELAVLLHDSVLDRNEWVGVRGGGTRLLTFASPEVTVELEILDSNRGLIGQVDGSGIGTVEICRPEGSIPVEIDPIGHFSSRSVPAGPMSIRVTDNESGAVTQTEWVVI
jgi:hypothetical protein